MMINNKFMLNKITVLITIILLLILVLFGMVDESWDFNDNSVTDLRLSLKEGTYNISIDYYSQADAGIFGSVYSNDQEYIIWSGFIPSSAGKKETICFPLSLDFSIRNNSLHFLTNNGVTISSLSIKNATYPIKELLCIVSYIAMIVLMTFLLRKNNHNTYSVNYFLISVGYLLFYPFFMINICILPIYIISVVLFYYYSLRKVTNNITLNIFLYYVLFSLFIMLFFTTSSPIYPFNLWTDENIYYAIGQGMIHGKTLYTDMFDHKGPCFFALYMIAYLISPGKYYGVYLIESVLMAISLFSIHRIALRYMSEEVSHLAAVMMIPFLLNSGYIGKGGSFEQMAISSLLYSVLLLMPEYANHDESSKYIYGKYIFLGFIFSTVFFSKFNVSFTWLVLVIPSFIKIIVNKDFLRFIKCFLAYLSGVLINVLWIIIYFKGDIQIPIEYYILFNKKYGAITSITDACVRIVNKAYSEVQKYPLSFVLIVIGISLLIFIDSRMNAYGKFAVIFAFVVIVGTTYAGHHAYAYYYSIIASFSFWGIIELLSIINKKGIFDNINTSTVVSVGFISFCLTFFINDQILDSIFIQREPYPQDIFAAQMNLYSPSDTSFYECGMMEWGFCSQAKADPYVQYFFYPNIDESRCPEVLNGQLDYINNQTTQFIITYGFDIDSPPYIPGLNENYHEISRIQYHHKTGESFWLYQKNNI